MLRVIYRSYCGENLKGRPPFYTKQLALASFVRAVETARAAGIGVEVVYMNDGLMPPERTALMARTGEQIQGFDVGNKPSLRLALDLPQKRGWLDRELLWLAEDDYLYLPHSLIDLAAAVERFPEVDYFALYASIGDTPPAGGTQPHYAEVPPGWAATPPVQVGSASWTHGLSTTATFGGRVGALREDRWLYELAMRAGGTWDQTMSMLRQGFLAFPWPVVRESLRVLPELGAKQNLKRFGIAGLRTALNLTCEVARTVRGGGPRRMLLATDPALITHMETGHLALGTDWVAAARDCAQWAAQQGIRVELPGIKSGAHAPN